MLVQKQGKIAFGDFGIRRERAFQIIDIGQKRLAFRGGIFGDDAGTALGSRLFGLIELTAKDEPPVDPLRFGPAMLNIAALMFAAFFSQPLVLLVAGGAVFRAFDKTLPPDAPPHYGVTAYFVILLCVLGYVCTLAPLGAHAQ